jgi:enterochelin esterase-like enzyme
LDFKAHFRQSSLVLLLLILLVACTPAAPRLPDSTQVPAVQSLPSPIIPAPTFTPSPRVIPSSTTAPVCREYYGHLSQVDIATSRLPRPLHARVYLPPCYMDHPDQPYPLLLMLHGQSYDDYQWQHVHLLDEADRLMSSKQIPAMIIVLPYEENTLADPYESGYGDVLVQDLLPWLESHYPVCADRSCRAIGGLSRGAAWAINIGLMNWKTFAAIGAHSLAPFFGDYTKLPYLAREIPKDQQPKVHMDSGKRDRYLAQARHYHELLVQNKLAVEYEELLGEHNEAYWSSNVEEYLRWYGQVFSPDQ